MQDDKDGFDETMDKLIKVAADAYRNYHLCTECYTCQMNVGGGFEPSPVDIEDFVESSGKKESPWRRSVRFCWHILTLRWLKRATRKSVDSRNKG